MARTSAWRSVVAALLAGVALGCTERLNSPGQCPELCPGSDIDVRDTVLTGVVVSDSSFRGFVQPFLTAIIVASDLDSARSVGVIRFNRRPDSLFTTTDTVPFPIGSVDSVQLEFALLVRDTLATNLKILVYRLPRDVDSATVWSDVLPWLHDSALVDTIAIDDTTDFTTIRRFVPASRMEPFPGDSGIVALGFDVRADIQTSVTIASQNFTGSPAHVRYFVRLPAPRDTVARTLDQTPTFDAFVWETPPPDPAPNVIAIGNLPSARSLLRFDLPRSIVDSTTIIRASLLLTPVRPTTGRPGETFELQAVPVLRDFGGKSILLPDTSTSGFGRVTAGSSDTVSIEIGRILRFWRFASDTLPRSIMVRNAAEDASLGELQAARAGAASGAPRLRITYIRPYRFGLP